MSTRTLSTNLPKVKTTSAYLSFDWLFVLLSTIFVTGLFIDGWAHNHDRVDESFFTPWHAIFYSGFVIVSGALFWQMAQNRKAGMSRRTIVPAGYEYALLGVFIFGSGGVADMVWHIIFGIEQGIEALFSPSHMLLAVGMVLIASGPFRAAWLRQEQESGWAKLLPVVLSATLFLSVITFLTQFAHPLVQVRPNYPVTSELSGSDIFQINTNGTGQTRLTYSFTAFNTHPAYSPDGSQIIFAAETEKGYELFLMNTDGTEVRQLTNNELPDLNPAFSPDGSQIVFVSIVNEREEIFLMNVDGSGLTNLTNHESRDYFPAWAPDGERLAFVSDRADSADIYLVRKDGSELVNLTQDDVWDFAPSWSPDGTRIVFDSERTSSVQVHILDLATNEISQLPTGEGEAFIPAWSPDGQQIAFVSPRTGDDEIYIVNLDGTGLRNVTNNPALNDSFPAWSLDGQSLIYRSRGADSFGDTAELAQMIGMAGIILQTGLLLGVVLLLIRRWTLPPGTFTLLFTANALGMAFLDDEFRFLLGILLAGLLADLLYARLRPAFDSPRNLRGFAFIVPFIFYAFYFAALFWTDTVTWSIHFWAGAIMIAGLVGLLMTHLTQPS